MLLKQKTEPDAENRNESQETGFYSGYNQILEVMKWNNGIT